MCGWVELILTLQQAITVIDRQVHIEDQLAPNIYLLGLVVAEELGLSRYRVLGSCREIQCLFLTYRIPKTHEVSTSWLLANIPLKSLRFRGKGIN